MPKRDHAGDMQLTDILDFFCRSRNFRDLKPTAVLLKRYNSFQNMSGMLKVKGSLKRSAKRAKVSIEREEKVRKREIDSDSKSTSESGSESDSDQNESQSDQIEDDDFEFDDDNEEESEDVGESAKDSDDSESDSSVYDLPSKSKRKPDNAGFSKAMSAILDSKIKAHDRKNPILVRSKKTAKDLESAKLEAKARKALNAEKRALLNKDRQTNLIPEDNAAQALEHEKTLRKIAQRGVVQLFNAIQAAQSTTVDKSKGHVIGLAKKEEQGECQKK